MVIGGAPTLMLSAKLVVQRVCPPHYIVYSGRGADIVYGIITQAIGGPDRLRQLPSDINNSIGLPERLDLVGSQS